MVEDRVASSVAAVSALGRAASFGGSRSGGNAQRPLGETGGRGEEGAEEGRPRLHGRERDGIGMNVAEKDAIEITRWHACVIWGRWQPL